MDLDQDAPHQGADDERVETGALPGDDTSDAGAGDQDQDQDGGEAGEAGADDAQGGAEDAAAAGGDGEAGDTEPPKPKSKVPDSVQKRINQLTRESKSEREARIAAETRADNLERLLKAQGVEIPDDEPAAATERPAARPATAPANETDVERRAREIADTREFNKKCDDLYATGAKEFDDFDDALKNLGAVGAISAEDTSFLEAIMETEASAKVLHHLGQDPDEAARILALPPRRQAIELDRLSAKLTATRAPRVSGAPDPIRPIDATGKPSQTIYDDDISDEDWMALREKQVNA